MLGENDLAVFYNTAEFAQVAVWQGQNINVIFDKTYAEKYGMASNNPVLRSPAISFAGVQRSQNVFVNNKNYLVQSYFENGYGEIIIELVKA